MEEMNHEIVESWNSVVSPVDTVYHLGDVFLSHAQEAQALLAKLNGYKILVLGNHDDKSDTWYAKAGFSEVYRRMLVLPSPIRPGVLTYLLTHVPVSYTTIEACENMFGHKVLNLHGHVHLVTDRSFTGDDIWEHPEHYRNFSCEKIGFIPQEIQL